MAALDRGTAYECAQLCNKPVCAVILYVAGLIICYRALRAYIVCVPGRNRRIPFGGGSVLLYVSVQNDEKQSYYVLPC